MKHHYLYRKVRHIGKRAVAPLNVIVLSLLLSMTPKGEARAQTGWKGLWSSLETECGLALQGIPQDMQDDGYGWLEMGLSFTVGYHFNDFLSLGIGARTVGQSYPSGYAFTSLYGEGKVRPFKGDLTPLAFNLRLGAPVLSAVNYNFKSDTSLSVSWSARNKLWHVFGGEVSAGVGLAKYDRTDSDIVLVERGDGIYEIQEQNKRTLHEINCHLFVRVAVLIN